MPSSTSLPKPSPKITFEPLAFAEAVHAEISHPGRLSTFLHVHGRMVAIGDMSSYENVLVILKCKDTLFDLLYGGSADRAALALRART